MSRARSTKNRTAKAGSGRSGGRKVRRGAAGRAGGGLRELEARFRATFEQVAVGMAHTTVDGRFLLANTRLCSMLGYSHVELVALTTRDLTHPEDRDQQDALRLELLNGKRAYFASEKRYLRRDGSTLWVNRTVTLAHRPSTGEPYLVQVIEDISERKSTEGRLQRLMRARRVMAECSHILIHAEDEIRMLEDMCRIVVESGGYKMAWVGFPSSEAPGGICAVAHAGFGEDKPMRGSLAWSADGRYQGFMSEVLASGQAHIARDILNDARHERRRARAEQHGFQSSIALPLTGAGTILGAAAIYAREADAFDPEEIGLLTELVTDVAYGIVNLRTRIARQQAEERSRENEQRFRETFEQAAVGITRVDLGGVIVDVNQKFCDMLGYSKPELLGVHIRDITHPEDYGQGSKYRAQLTHHAMKSASGEKRFIRKDGSVLWARRTMSTVTDGAGKPLYVISVVEDITERKEFERRFELTFNHAAVGMTQTDLDSRFIQVNRKFEEMLGYSRDELVGMSAIELTHPDDRQETVAAREQLLRGEIDSASSEKRLVRKNGHVIWTNRTFSLARGVTGEPVCFITVVEDITERKEFERRYRETFDQAAVGIVHTSEDGRYLRVNQRFCEMLGYSESELVGRAAAEFTHPEDREKGADGRPRLWAGEIDKLSEERRYFRKDGRVIWTNRTVSLARDAAGRPMYFIRVIEDITERKEFERRFRETFDQAAVGILHTALDGRYLRVNRKLCDITGYSEDELTGGAQPRLSHPDDLDSGGHDRERLLSGQIASHSNEKRYVRKDRRVIWVNRTESLARDASGAPMYFIRVIEDITGRKEAEERYRATFDNAPVGIMHTALDDYRILHANRKLCEMLGYSLDALLAMTSTDIVHPDFRYSDRRSYMAQLLGGEIQSFASERKFIRKDGSPVWVNRTVSLVRDASGNPQYFIRVIEDVSERRQAEEAVARERGLLRSVIDTVPDFIYVKDADGRFQVVNEAWLRSRGLSADQVAGKTVFDLFPREVAEDMAADDAAVLRTREVKSDFESRLPVTGGSGEPGEKRWVSTTKAPMLDGAGNILGVVGVSRDITERKRAEAALRRSEEQFRQLAGNIPQVFWITDVHHRETIYISPAAAVLTGRPLQGLLDWPRELIRSVHPEDRRRVYEARKAAAHAGYDQTYRVVRPDGTTRWVNDRAFPVMDENGNLYRIAGITEDVTDRKLAEERLRQLAHYDVLTDLPNRVLFYDRLRQVLAQAKRSQWTVAVMFVDLDRFKNVNDTLGHAVGDQLLRQVSERLSGAVRSGDTVGRLGGDEFAIVLSNLASAQDASIVAQKLMASFNEPFKLQGADFYVTASIGITLYPDDATEQEILLRNADAAMYRAKEIGRNNYQFYRSEMNARALELLSMESDMRRAFDREEFLLHYQPKASLADGRIVGVEALLRWQHPERGLVTPADFMHVLEDTGLIVRVGERVVNAVCRQIRSWQADGIDPVPVAINLSAREFAAKDLAGVMTRILGGHGVDPSLIELEITESSLMVNSEEVVATLEALGRLGIGLSIDDFGTGYSSLAYLKRFPLDAVKIDRSFVKDITTDADDATITLAVISMAHSLGLQVIAEGVETEAQLAFLARHGCDQIQGYYFARPLAAEECGVWLRERRRLKPVGAGLAQRVASSR